MLPSHLEYLVEEPLDGTDNLRPRLMFVLDCRIKNAVEVLVMFIESPLIVLEAVAEYPCSLNFGVPLQ